ITSVTFSFHRHAGFKWFGSLANLSSRCPSEKSKNKAASQFNGSLCGDKQAAAVAVQEKQSVDDMKSGLRSPSYARSSDMHTHVCTGPRSEKQKKSFKGLKVAESTEKMSWKAEEHVRDSPLLSALSSLSMMSTEQPQLVLARPLPTSHSQASPLTSAPASCFKDLSEEHVTQSEATRGKTAMEHLNLVSKQDVYVPMDPISGRACSHVDPQAEKQETTEASQKVDANGR
ncbi:hypothetical protein GOODEAATRI_011264, partial [Goodea atripinnis]